MNNHSWALRSVLWSDHIFGRPPSLLNAEETPYQPYPLTHSTPGIHMATHTLPPKMWAPWACGRKSVSYPWAILSPMLFYIPTERHWPLSNSCLHALGRMFMCCSAEAMQASRDLVLSSALLRNGIQFCHNVKGFFQISQIQAWNTSPLLGYQSWKIKPILALFFHSLRTVSWGLFPGTWSSGMLILWVYISCPCIDDDLLDASLSPGVSHTVHSI